MKRITFAKIFIVKNYQVLVTKRYDEEEHLLIMETKFPDFMPELKMGFHDERALNKAFDEYDQKQAELFIKRMEDNLL